ncbi:MAG TPA: hypothetical protein VJ873_11375, partial [bacterium]|nr:hypothetical protein [bacterium]
KNFDIKFDKLLSVDYLDDGIVFAPTNKSKPYVVQIQNSKNIEVIRAIFETAKKSYTENINS